MPGTTPLRYSAHMGTGSSARPSAGRSISRTLEKGLKLLALFDAQHPQWSLRELREATGEPKTTVLRLVKTLEDLGYLARDQRSGRLRLGPTMLRLSYVNSAHNELVRVAVPHMRRLCEITNQPIDLTVKIDQESIMTLYDATPRFVRPQAPVGRIARPGLTTAASKIFAAFQPEETWDAILADAMRPLTDRSITDPALIREQLLRVRLEGVAYDIGESSVELAGVGAPVFGPEGDVSAVLSVVAPIEQAGSEELAGYANAVRGVAADLSQELGAPLQLAAFLRNRLT